MAALKAAESGERRGSEESRSPRAGFVRNKKRLPRKSFSAGVFVFFRRLFPFDSWIVAEVFGRGELADEGLQAAREGMMPPIHFSIALTVGYERTGESRFLQMMGLLLDQVYWHATGVSGEQSVKPIAKAFRGLTRLFGHAWRHGLLDAYEYPSVREMPERA